MKVLIIDGSATARKFIKLELEHIKDIEFIEARNGKEGIDKTLSELPDVITTSLMLQDSNAVKITAKIRKNPQISHIPVIIITASPDEKLLKQAFENGAAELFSKPFKPGKLKQYIEEIYDKDLKLDKLNILVVDDSRIMLSLIRSILSLQGANVIECHDGEDAIDVLNSGQEVDMVITDYIMPKKDGIALSTYIRKELDRSDLPIIILTSIGEPSVVLNALRAGANDYLTKPFSRDELLARIKNHAQLIYFHRQLQLELKEREKREKAVKEELKQAKETQQTILPQRVPDIPSAKVYCKYQPMDLIGGDFYNIFELYGNKYGIMVADVTGHGVPAALISFMVSTIFQSSVKESESTDVVLRKTNDALHNKLQDGKFATMFYGVYDADARILKFTNAGHPDAFVVRSRTNEVYTLSSKGLFVGPFDSIVAGYEERSFQLEAGDKLLLYTDAILEVTNASNDQLGKNSLVNFIQENCCLPIDDLIEAIYTFGLKFSADRSFGDDFTLIGMDIY